MPEKPKYDPKKAGMNFPSTGDFDSPAMRRVVFDLPMTDVDKKDFKNKAERKKFYKDRMGTAVFVQAERKIRDGHHQHRMSAYDKKSKASKGG